MINTSLPFKSGRQPILARNIVSCSQPLAAQAGAAVLARGGNAIDAAIAAAITLTVVEPTQNGIGGDAFVQVWDGSTLHGLNASGRSPAAWKPGQFADNPTALARGANSVTVPGAVSAWVELSRKFGALPFDELFVDAIRHATDGFPVSPIIARQWSEQAAVLKDYPGFQDMLLQGSAPLAGQIWRNPAQAETLGIIAKTKGDSFYNGDLAVVSQEVVHPRRSGKMEVLTPNHQPQTTSDEQP